MTQKRKETPELKLINDYDILAITISEIFIILSNLQVKMSTVSLKIQNTYD